MKIKKIIFIIVTIIILVTLIVLSYIYLLKKTEVSNVEASVYNLALWNQERGITYEQSINIIKSLLYDSAYENDFYTTRFYKQSELPSSDISDYSIVRIDVSLINEKILDDFVSTIAVSGYDNSERVLLVGHSIGNVVEINKSGGTDFVRFTLYIYSGEATHEEIESIIRKLSFQLTYSNKIVKNGTIEFSLSDAVFTFNE